MIFLYVVIYKGPWGLKNLIFQPFSLKNIKQNWVVLDVDIGTGMQKQDRSYKCQSKQKADHWVKGKVEKFLQLQNETLESIQPESS